VWLGLLFAWCARERVKLDGVWSQPSVTLVAVFIGMIRLPVALYLHLAHPHWSWLYLVDAGKVPRLTIVPIVAVASGSVIGGWYLGARLVRMVKEKILLSGLAASGALLFLVTFLCRDRLMHYGSYEQFHAGNALPLGDVKLGYVLIAVVVGVIASVGFVSWELKRDGRRAASR
jgi:hypothetical protein